MKDLKNEMKKITSENRELRKLVKELFSRTENIGSEEC